MVLSRKTLETNTLTELVALLKERGDKATIGFAGVGSNSYVCATVLQQLIGVKLAMVPYRGTGPAMNDLVAGQIDVLCDQATTAVPQIQGGTVKAYAVTSAQRLASLQDVPSNKEAGLPGLEVTIWNGAYAPKGTPKEVIDRWNAASASSSPIRQLSSASRPPAPCRSRPRCARPPRTPSSSRSSSSSTPRCSLPRT